MAEESAIPDDACFAEMIKTAFDPEIVSCISAIRVLADYDISPELAAPFLRFHAFITDPQPSYISDWREDPAAEKKWYHAHVNGVLGDVRGAVAGAHYHAERLLEIEANVTAFLEISHFKELMGHSTMAPGPTRKMFVLAYRRSLDYLAGALSCYFKTEVSSFRTLPKSIRNTKSPAVAISEAHGRHAGKLDFSSIGRSQIDKKSYCPLRLCVGRLRQPECGRFLHRWRRRGFVYGPDFKRASLVQVLTQKLELLHDCVRDLLDSFVAAAREQNNS